MSSQCPTFTLLIKDKIYTVNLKNPCIQVRELKKWIKRRYKLKENFDLAYQGKLLEDDAMFNDLNLSENVPICICEKRISSSIISADDISQVTEPLHQTANVYRIHGKSRFVLTSECRSGYTWMRDIFVKARKNKIYHRTCPLKGF